MVEELSRFNNICILTTSRITTTPPDFKHLDVPTLSIDAAHDTFYRICDSNDRSNLVDAILEQLDFHPLSITLLAAVARQNKWGMKRFARELERRRTDVLRIEHNMSLAATIELSLSLLLYFKSLDLTLEHFWESSPFSHKASMKTMLAGCFPRSPTEPISSTSSASFL